MSYSRIADHASMVFDERRNTAFAAALRKCVQPGCVVLDLGAGLGLHGLMALESGASHVYLVDPSPVVLLAGEVAARAGWSDRVTVVQDRIEEVALPQPVDLIVSVLTGNLLFSEDLLPSLLHARDRHLAPGGKLLPDRAQLMLAPVSAPSIHARQVARWSKPLMGIDFAAIRAFAANELITLSREESAQCGMLGPASVMVDMDFARCDDADCAGFAPGEVQRDGVCDGLLGWIRIHLGGEWLSTGPGEPPVHWRPVYLPIDPPLPLRSGESIELALTRPAQGDWTWSIKAESGMRRQSTFLSGADGPAQWLRSAPGSAPGLGMEGRRARAVLEGLARGASIAEIAEQLREADAAFAPGEALRLTQSLASRFGGRT